MSTLYRLLEEKVFNSSTRDKIVYAEMPESVEMSDYNKCIGFTYSNFYDLVEYYIRQIKSDNSISPIVFVDNSVASIAIIMAMRILNITPILIDSSSRRYFAEYSVPFIYKKSLDHDSLADYFVKNVVYPNIVEKIDADFVICTSGSEDDKPHFISITEEELLNMNNQYGEDGSTFYSYISSANISGLLTNLVNPLLHDSKVVMRTRFDLNVFDPVKKEKGPEEIIFEEPYLFSDRDPKLAEKLFTENWSDKVVKIVGNKLLVGKVVTKADPIDKRPYYKNLDLKVGSLEELGMEIDEVMLPRDMLIYLERSDCSNLDFSGLKHIYLSGGINSKSMVDAIREKVPSIKENVMINLYGSTEAGGVICSCPEKDFKACYIDASNCLNGELIYTFDKENFFSIVDGKVEKVDRKFNDETFVEYLPTSNKMLKNINIKPDFTISYKSGRKRIDSTDIGAYIDDQLYVIGRKSSIVNIQGKSYFLDSLEAHISRELGADTYCRLGVDDHIALFIDCEDKGLDYKIEMYGKALDFCDHYKELKFTYPILLDEDSFPRILVSGKIARAQLDVYRSFAGRQHFNFALRDYSKKEMFKEIIDKHFKKYNVTYTEDEYQIKLNVGNNYFFDIGVASRFFDVITFDDSRGEIVLRFNDNYMFDISTTNLLLEYPSMAGFDGREFVIGALISNGVDYYTKEEIKNYTPMMNAYRKISPNMPSQEIIRQLRINIVVSLLNTLPIEVWPFIINGADQTIHKMMLEGTPAEEVKKALQLLEEIVNTKHLEQMANDYDEYVNHHIYKPNRNSN